MQQLIPALAANISMATCSVPCARVSKFVAEDSARLIAAVKKIGKVE